MRLLDHYIAKRFFIFLGFSIISLWIVYVVFELLTEIQSFIYYKPEFLTIIQYYLMKSPRIIVEICPYAVLITTLLSLSYFSNRNEIVAMKAAGISLYRIILPFLIISLFISFFILFLNDQIVPKCYEKLLIIKKVKIEKQRLQLEFQSRENITFTGKNKVLYFIQFYDAKKQVMFDINIFYLNKYHSLVKKIEAKKAQYKNGKWYFYEGTIYFPSLKKYNLFERKIIPLKDTPQNFVGKQKDPKEMNYRELKEYIRRLKDVGFDMKKDLVELYKKIIFPFANFIILFLGIPFAISSKRTFSPAKGFGISLVIYLNYWYIMAFAEALGKSGFFPPLFSVCLPDIIFFSIGVFLLIRTDK